MQPVRRDPPRIGISACLLGAPVRHDGSHRRDPFLVEALGAHVSWVPFCPEMELGLGAPRETLKLVEHPDGPRLIARSGADHTRAMAAVARERIAALGAAGLSGVVVKKNSPSCGLFRVRVYGAAGSPARPGRGAFTAALAARLPELPIEEEGRLHDPALREHFVERVFAHRRLRDLFDRRFTLGELVAHHAAEKLLLLAHDPASYGALGRLVARARTMSRAELVLAYHATTMQALARPATVPRHVNVLEHIAGFFRDRLDVAGRRELAAVIAEYRRRLVPLSVPVTLVRYLAHRHGLAWLSAQRYLDPHPRELALRHHLVPREVSA